MHFVSIARALITLLVVWLMTWGASAHAVEQVVIIGQRGGGLAGIPGLFFSSRNGMSNLRAWQIAKPASLSNSAPSCASGNPSTAHPVIIATGEKHKEEVDFAAAQAGGLELRRTYRSFDLSSSLFGGKWMSTYDHPALGFVGCAPGGGTQTPTGSPFAPLDPGAGGADASRACAPLHVVVTSPDGSRHSYTTQDGGFSYRVGTSAAQGVMTRVSIDNFWNLSMPGGATYRYAANGQITQVLENGAPSLTFTYAPGTRQLTRVSNRAGQSVQFIWSGTRVTRVVDPAGSSWTYGYDGNGRLASVTSPGSPADVRTYVYEGTDKSLLTGILHNGVRYSTYRYGADGRVLESGLSGGEEKDSFVYGTDKTTVTSAAGQPTTYTYANVQGSRKLVGVSRAVTSTCSAAAASVVYDSNGWVDYELDWNGVKTDYSYDNAGKLLQLTTAAGTPVANTIVNTWSGNDLTRRVFKGADNVAYAQVDYAHHQAGLAAGAVSSETWTDLRSGGSRHVSYAYAFHPNHVMATRTVTRSLPGGSAVTTSTYDALGNLISVKDPIGTQSWSAFDGLGRPARHVDRHGITTEFTYHPTGNVLTRSLVLPNGRRTTTYAYASAREVSDVHYADGSALRLRYNGARRAEAIGNAQSEFVHSAFDVASNTATESSTRHVPSLSGSTPFPVAAGTFSSSTEMDSLRRPRVVRGNGGQSLTTTYDGNGNVKTRTDAAMRVTQFAYDAQDRLQQIIEPGGGSVTYTYDATGQIASVKDQRNLVTRYTYNGLGQLLSEQSPDRGLTQYQYDAAGRLERMTPASGHAVTYRFDALDRMTSRTANGVTESFFYDDASVHGKGRLTKISDASGQTTFAYTAAGELRQQVTTILGISYTTQWDYDAAGRLLSMSYPAGGPILSYAYDAHGRLSSVSAGAKVLAGSMLYQPATDRRYAWRAGNNVPRLLTRDADHRLTQISSPGLHQIALGYSTTDTIGSLSDAVVPALNATFGYDPIDQLSSVSRGADGQQFQLDKSGNRLAHTRAGVSYAYSIAPTSHRLLQWSGAGAFRSFGYQANGNVATETRHDGQGAYTYDSFNRLAQVTLNGATLGSYLSNAFNQRAAKTAGGVTRRFVHGPGGQLLAEIGAAQS